MCGICGVVGKGMQSKDVSAFRDLLHVTGLRGDSSTGVFAFNPGDRKNRYRLRKRLGPSASLLYEDERKKIQDSIIGSIMVDLYMGHCRYPTKGVVSVENAHPFDTGRYVGTHNGTLVDSKYRHKRKTDSEMMFEDMERRGIREVLTELEYMSAYAISVFDKRDQTLTLATNGDRPLNFSINKERRVLYYASELSALHFVSERRKIEMEFYRLEPDIIYTTKIGDITNTRDDFWSSYELPKKSAPAGKQWDWMEMRWKDEEKTPVGERACLTCGTVLSGDELKNADVFEYQGHVYYTCDDCLNTTTEAIKKSAAA